MLKARLPGSVCSVAAGVVAFCDERYCCAVVVATSGRYRGSYIVSTGL